MSPKLVTFLVFLFILGQTCALLIEGAWYGETERTMLNEVVGFNIITLTDVGILKVPTANFDYFRSLWAMLRWDYPFRQGEMELFKWIVLYPFTAGALWAMLQIFISAAFGIFRRG